MGTRGGPQDINPRTGESLGVVRSFPVITVFRDMVRAQSGLPSIIPRDLPAVVPCDRRIYGAMQAAAMGPPSYSAKSVFFFFFFCLFFAAVTPIAGAPSSPLRPQNIAVSRSSARQANPWPYPSGGVPLRRI